MRQFNSITYSMDMNMTKLGDSGGQGSLACCSRCSLWGHKESDMTYRLNNSNKSLICEGPQHRQAPLPGRAQLYQAHGDNDAVKYVPLLLEVIVGVQGYDFEDHFSSKKHGKYLQTETGIHLSGVCEVVANDKQGRGEMSCL